MSIEAIEVDLKQCCAPTGARVTLAQTQVPEPPKMRPAKYLDDVAKSELKDIIEQQSERIRRQLKRALLDEPNFILFPELSIPWEMQDEIRKYAIREKVYIIGGLTYGPNFENACAVFTPFKIDKMPIQYKLNRAPAEDKNVKTGNRLLIFKNSGFGTFACIICYDFTSLNLSREIRKHSVNLLFCPTLNHSVDLFDNMATSQCYTMYSFICLCNSAGSRSGNSASYGPLRVTGEGKLQQERIIGKIAGNQETTLTTKLNIPGLIESISRFKSNKEVVVGFITPPADLRESGTIFSPFTPMGPAKENFVGRREQIQEFWAAVESNNHILLLGPSGTGKTSLIHRIRSEMPMEYSAGIIEVYDNENTFAFLRRLSIEITTLAEPEIRNLQFTDSLNRALDDIKKTRDAVAKYGYQESSKAFLEAFHSLAQAIDAQRIGKLIVFIDQAERLAWLEKELEKNRHAIRNLISIMRDLNNLGAPVIFVLAIRQHDYDPLIVLANNHIPASIVGVQEFSIEDSITAVEKPLPPEITINRDVSSKIADLAKGSPFFVQLIADITFKNLGKQKAINTEIFEGLKINDQRDVFPILMNVLTPNEVCFVETMGAARDYIVKIEAIAQKMNLDIDECRHIADLLLGKNIVESVGDDSFRFVHDQMKGFVLREWLAAKMDDREKLRTETETSLQMLLMSPEDEITVTFILPHLALCAFKSLWIEDSENLYRILEKLASIKQSNAIYLCLA
ncbi:AAA family ATPase, partial [Acidobacteriota bacterium]